MSRPKVAAATKVHEKSHQMAGRLKVTEHFFDVPKDYHDLNGNTIRIFARSVRKHESPIVATNDASKDQLPWMCFVNGGPGLPCRSPQHYPFTRSILDAGYQLLFLDQRGTGLSTPITASTLQRQGDNAAQAQYLKLHRADNIVRDCEAIRQAVTADYPEDKKKGSIIGQSFGGFCSIPICHSIQRYTICTDRRHHQIADYFRQGLRESFIFGGLAPLVKSPDEVYRRLYVKVKERNQAYYAKYPEDVENVKTIVRFLSKAKDGKTELPSGGNLTCRRFLAMGIALGMHGGLDSVHDIVLKACNDIEMFDQLTRGTLSSIDDASGLDNNPLYAMIHEPIYCVGTAPKWSAHRILAEFPEFEVDYDGHIHFTGEMIYPWMFEDFVELRKMQEVAERIASDPEWPDLWDEEQLQRNEVPVYAISYIDDMYVDVEFAKETARKIKGCKVAVTNIYFHDAIRSRMDEVVRQAFALRDDVIE